MIKGVGKSSRRREFSDAREFLNASHSHFQHASSMHGNESVEVRNENSSQRIFKPGKWNVLKSTNKERVRPAFGHTDRSMNVAVLDENHKSKVENKNTISSNNNREPIHRCTTKQVCVNCVNKLVADKKQKQKKLRQKKEKQEEITEIQKLKTLTFKQNKSPLNNKYKTKQTPFNEGYQHEISKRKDEKVKEKFLEAEKSKQLEEDFKKRCQLQIVQEHQKKQKFNRQLKEQIQQQRNRKRYQEEQNKLSSSFLSIYQNNQLVSNKREEIQLQYKRGLEEQIKEKQEKTARQRQADKSTHYFDQQTPSSSFVLEQHLLKHREEKQKGKSYAEALQAQINTKRELKQKQELEETLNQQKFLGENKGELERRLREEKMVKEKAVGRYAAELKGQIERNKSKREGERQDCGTWGMNGQEGKGERLEDCENCHYKFPKKYLSTVEID